MSSCSEVMKPIETASCCTPSDTTADAARTMRDSGHGCAPVIEDTESFKLVGLVTERDVCCGVAADDNLASEVRVEKIMQPSSACCGADEPVDEARKKLHEHRTTAHVALTDEPDLAKSCDFTLGGAFGRVSTPRLRRLSGPLVRPGGTC